MIFWKSKVQYLIYQTTHSVKEVINVISRDDLINKRRNKKSSYQ